VLCGLTLGALALAARPASADLILFENNGWTFFTDGRINTFFSAATGDDFPSPTPNIDPATGMVRDPSHGLIGASQPFTAGFPTQPQGNDGKYSAARMRSGFLGTIIAFGVKRQVAEATTLKSYVALWATAETSGRDRTADNFAGRAPDFNNPYRGFDVREGWLGADAPWGSFIAGRQGGILGSMSTQIDFLYGHNYGLGLPCPESYYPTCGHIGTGALGNGVAAGFTYTTPSLAGLQLKLGLYDPVRLLGAWERVPYPRPEGALWWERRFSPSLYFKAQVEGMYQYLAIREDRRLNAQGQLDPRTDAVWGVAGGVRLEAGPLRLGLSAYHGKGLGAYIALQNAASTFDSVYLDLRTFTGVYAQTALVFGREQLSFGIGRVLDHQLESDKNGHIDQDGNLDLTPAYGISNLKYQTGISGAFYHHVTDFFVLGIDYFYFRTDWWGARNSALDPTTNQPVLLPGSLPGEKQVVHFINLGATFHW
jgi:hypothetical protein